MIIILTAIVLSEISDENQINNIKLYTVQDIRMDGAQKAPAWFWVALVLLIVGAVVVYLIV